MKGNAKTKDKRTESNKKLHFSELEVNFYSDVDAQRVIILRFQWTSYCSCSTLARLNMVWQIFNVDNVYNTQFVQSLMSNQSSHFVGSLRSRFFCFVCAHCCSTWSWVFGQIFVYLWFSQWILLLLLLH